MSKTYVEGLEEYVETLSKILCSRKNDGEIVYFIKVKEETKILLNLEEYYFKSVVDIFNKLNCGRGKTTYKKCEYGYYYQDIINLKKFIDIYSFDVTSEEVRKVFG